MELGPLIALSLGLGLGAWLLFLWSVRSGQYDGLPRYTQVDNEGCFSGGFTHPAVLGQVVRLALWVGTELVFSPMYHPESNGYVERFHQDYDRHVWDLLDLPDRSVVTAQSDRFFNLYRHSPHHTALQGQTPAEVHFRKAATRLPADFTSPTRKLPLTPGRIHFIRRVSSAGSVRVLNLDWRVPEPQPDQGVWVTIEFTLAGATLSLYDAAPDAQDRTCLASYPFPLKEAVQPHPGIQPTPQPEGLSTPETLPLTPGDLTLSHWRVLTPVKPPGLPLSLPGFVANVLRSTVKVTARFISTMW